MGSAHYHFGLKKDEKRGVYAIQAYDIAGVTFHARTATYDHEEKDYRYKVGQVRELSDEKVAAIKKALRVDKAPSDLKRDVDEKTKQPIDPRALKYRKIARGTGSGSTFVATELVDVAGFGKVVQWAPVRDDQGKRVIGWLSKVLDLEGADYAPVDDPANEAPLSDYIFFEKKNESDFNPPSIDLGPDETDVVAAKTEAQEQARDPKGFDATQDRIKKAKASGLKLEG